ncbi:MAG: amidohydrolase family protein [Candidatus Thorarchaeota archaeon]
MTESWKYNGPLFDAHTHIEGSNLRRMVEIEEEFGVSAQIAIVHSDGGPDVFRSQYPQRFVFARYLSLNDIAHYRADPVIDEIKRMKDQGYLLAKSWFGPRWRDYIKDVPDDFSIDDPRLEPIFQTLEDTKTPLLIHVGDPDTYYSNQYKNVARYGTKEDHLSQLERVIERHPGLLFHLPHFASQPEIHRLPNLAKWMDRFPNIIIDTASSRWMARELSKDVEQAREFMMKYSDRVLFGTDLASYREMNKSGYEGRYIAQRALWESNAQGRPLPFTDPDTEKSGGTIINGLDLPLSVLNKLYWRNAIRIYGMPAQ